MALPSKDERSLLHDRLDHAQYIRGYPIMVGTRQCDLRPIRQVVDPCNGNSNWFEAAKGWQTGKTYTIDPSDKLLLGDVTNALGLDQHLAGCCPAPVWTVLIGNDGGNLLPVTDSHVVNHRLRCNRRAQTSTYHAESESGYKAHFYPKAFHTLSPFFKACSPTICASTCSQMRCFHSYNAPHRHSWMHARQISPSGQREPRFFGPCPCFIECWEVVSTAAPGTILRAENPADAAAQAPPRSLVQVVAAAEAEIPSDTVTDTLCGEMRWRVWTSAQGAP